MLKPSIIISGGGTGGHIYPAIAIADALKAQHPESEILFVGAQGKMEMQKVPKAGYKIIGLPIRGLQRRFTLENFKLPFLIIKSLFKARKILKQHKPNIVIGVGGYASMPLLFMASLMKIATLIQEQNSYPGISNKLLAKKVNHICAAYSGMQKYFDGSKIQITGNPIRKDLLKKHNREASLKHFKLDEHKKTILCIGGSLGARTINKAVEKALENWQQKDYQIIWQTGKFYFESLKKYNNKNVLVKEFIYDMPQAYAAADLVISRAGALSVSEIQAQGKATIFIPSPNVAEDHQTKNAQALVAQHAALILKDAEAVDQLEQLVNIIINDKAGLERFEKNCYEMRKTDATEQICKLIAPYLESNAQSSS